MIENVPEDPGPELAERLPNGPVRIWAAGSLDEAHGLARTARGDRAAARRPTASAAGPTIRFAAETFAKSPRVDYRGIVTLAEALELAAGCDAVFCFYAPVNVNMINASPNKVNDALAVGRPVIINSEVKVAAWVAAGRRGLHLRILRRDVRCARSSRGLRQKRGAAARACAAAARTVRAAKLECAGATAGAVLPRPGGGAGLSRNMCGIAGYVGLDDPGLLARMATAWFTAGLTTAAPGTTPTARVGLAHRRLSIIDPSPAGHQPMSIEDGTVLDRLQRRDLQLPGAPRAARSRRHRFRAAPTPRSCCTSTASAASRHCRMLNGMFAFAIWDAERRRLVLARDHAGVKPLYYWSGRRHAAVRLRDQGAAAQRPCVPNELNPEALSDYLSLLWVPGETTMLRGIRKLEAGHYLQWQDGRIEVQRWFTLDYEPDRGPLRARVGRGDARSTFVAHRRAARWSSDVPLGAFLSGGLDSSSIVVCDARRVSRPATSSLHGALDAGGRGGASRAKTTSRMRNASPRPSAPT